MKVLIFGHDIVRQHLINQLVGKKYQLRIFGRHVLENVTEIEHVELFTGSIFAELDIRKALVGVDAVISVIDAKNDGTDVSLSLGMKKIVHEMEAANIKRLIALGGPAALDVSEDDHTLLVDTDIYPEQNKAQGFEQKKALDVLKHSKLDWTYVCPAAIVDGVITHQYHTAKNHPTYGRAKINASDLAEFIIHELENNEYLKTRVSISN